MSEEALPLVSRRKPEEAMSEEALPLVSRRKPEEAMSEEAFRRRSSAGGTHVGGSAPARQPEEHLLFPAFPAGKAPDVVGKTECTFSAPFARPGGDHGAPARGQELQSQSLLFPAFPAGVSPGVEEDPRVDEDGRGVDEDPVFDRIRAPKDPEDEEDHDEPPSTNTDVPTSSSSGSGTASSSASSGTLAASSGTSSSSTSTGGHRQQEASSGDRRNDNRTEEQEASSGDQRKEDYQTTGQRPNKSTQSVASLVAGVLRANSENRCGGIYRIGSTPAARQTTTLDTSPQTRTEVGAGKRDEMDGGAQSLAAVRFPGAGEHVNDDGSVENENDDDDQQQERPRQHVVSDLMDLLEQESHQVIEGELASRGPRLPPDEEELSREDHDDHVESISEKRGHDRQQLLRAPTTTESMCGPCSWQDFI